MCWCICQTASGGFFFFNSGFAVKSNKLLNRSQRADFRVRIVHCRAADSRRAPNSQATYQSGMTADEQLHSWPDLYWSQASSAETYSFFQYGERDWKKHSLTHTQRPPWVGFNVKLLQSQLESFINSALLKHPHVDLFACQFPSSTPLLQLVEWNHWR